MKLKRSIILFTLHLSLLTLHPSLLTLHLIAQPCLPEGITFTTQEEIDSFQVNYPGCTEIEGHVHIFGSDITNLNGLSIVTNIGENLHIISSQLINLTGLDNLTYIGGDLNISGNGVLNQLTGLGSLITIQVSLKMGLTIGPHGNPSLTNFNGLDNLTTIGEDLKIIDHDSLINFTGLENLVSIGGSFHVGIIGPPGPTGNPSLISFDGLNNLSSINGDVQILFNPSLISLSGLESIDPVSITDLYVYGNESLYDCDVQSICDYLVAPGGTVEIDDNAPGCNSQEEVEADCENNCLPEGIVFSSQEEIDNFQINYPGCTEIEGDVKINEADINNLSGLNVLTSIGGDLLIGDDFSPWIYNYSLTTLTGLESLTSIGGNLHISRNPSLTSLDGLNALSFIGGSLGISGNPILMNLNGLNVLSSIGGSLGIVSNHSLTNLTGLENLTNIPGSLHIGTHLIYGAAGNTSLTNFTGLNNLATIGGDFWIVENDSLLNFTGLENLTSIGGELAVGYDGPPIGGYGNPSLINFNGLENLSSINGDLTIINSPSLTSLSGLENIDANSIESLCIANNNSLSNCEIQSMCDYLSNPNGVVVISGNGAGCNSPAEIAGHCGIILPCLPFGVYNFSSQADIDNFGLYSDCTELEGNVHISGNDITHLNGLSDVTTIGGSLTMSQMNLLTNFSGLDNLSYIGSYLFVWENNSLVSFSGLGNLTSLGGFLRIKQNTSLNNLSGLDNLTSINGHLEISENNSLISLTGLNNVTTIGEDLEIRENNSLISLVGIEGLTSIDGGALYISENNSLKSLYGLENIEGASINILDIFNNDSLSVCNVQSICDFIYIPGGNININNNAQGCNSLAQVQEACDPVLVSELIHDALFTISPNPITSNSVIQYNLPPKATVTIKILDMTGQTIMTIVDNFQQQGEQQVFFNSSGLQAGIYFCVISNGKGVQTMKIIKL